MRQLDLPVGVLENVALAALQHAELAALEARRVVTALEAAPARLDAREPDRLVAEELEETADGVAAATDAGDHLIAQPALAGHDLLAQFLADDAVEIADHHRIRVRPERRAEDVVRAADIGLPVAHRLVDRVLERLLSGVSTGDLGAQQSHSEDI